MSSARWRAGASGIFQRRLSERLSWARGTSLAEHQRKLAYQYLDRGDFVRAAVFGWEAVVSRECAARGFDPRKFKEGREPAAEALEEEIQAGEHEDWKRDAYWMLKNLRNALAHGSPPSAERFRAPLRSPGRLRQELKGCFQRLLG